MEVLRRRRAVGDADVAIGTECQEALDPGARVLGSLTLVAVREEQREAGRLPPLGEPGDDELIDDHFAAVGEVAELGLPQDQGLGRRGGVAVLEAQTRELGERAVVQLERRPRPGKILDRCMAAAVPRVVQHEVSLAERAALRVLARERSEEHTSELQSLAYLVCRLLLEKK